MNIKLPGTLNYYRLGFCNGSNHRKEKHFGLFFCEFENYWYSYSLNCKKCSALFEEEIENNCKPGALETMKWNLKAGYKD